MKERIVLITMILTIWGCMVFSERYLPDSTSVVIIMTIMFGYSILLFIAELHNKRQQKKLKPKEASSYIPHVNIFIPAHNEAQVIDKTVENLLQLDYEYYDIHVIDDRSNDHTGSIIKKLAEDHIGKVFAYFRDVDAFPGKSAVLNDLLVQTHGEIICVFDADARVEPDFLFKAVKYLEDKETGALQVRKVIYNSRDNLLTLCQDNEYLLDSKFQIGRNSLRSAVELRGNGELIRRKALESVGGWNIWTLTDDLDLSTQLHLKGWDVRFCNDITVQEQGIKSFKALLKQRKRWAEGSVRRYLENCDKIMTSHHLTLRVSLDMLSYMFQLILPIWIASELVLGFIIFMTIGKPTTLIFATMILPALTLFFLTCLVISLVTMKKANLFEALMMSIVTSVYMVTIWVPTVIFVVGKIIFFEKDMNWSKTDHFDSCGKNNIVSV